MNDDDLEPPEREEFANDYAEYESMKTAIILPLAKPEQDYSNMSAEEIAALGREQARTAMAEHLSQPKQKKKRHIDIEREFNKALAEIDVSFDIQKFSLRGESQNMRENMINQVDVLKGLAVLGQMTAIYAKPNTGKTLLSFWLIIEAIKQNGIDSNDVYYINADDSYAGLVCKLEIAERHGFHMLAPGFKDFRAPDFLSYLSQLIKSESAKGKIIFLDTLKKFADLMDKKSASNFGVIARSFVQHGGSIIMLAHTNKNRDANGKLIFSGTSDIVDDVDCAYILDAVQESAGVRTVLFENIKSRGNVEREVAFSYSVDETDYNNLLSSVRRIEKSDAAQMKDIQAMKDQLDKNTDAIEAIRECIAAGFNQKTTLIAEAAKISGLSKPRIAKVLKAHTGANEFRGHRWVEVRGDKAAKIYKLLNNGSTPSDDYERNSDGE
jgi:peroxiredoxin family protein